MQLDQPICPYPGLLLGLLNLAARPRQAPHRLRHIAPSLDRKACNLPQPNCDCRIRQKTQPKGIDPKTGKPHEPIEIPVPKRDDFERLLKRAAHKKPGKR